jgi:hypothetical protein
MSTHYIAIAHFRLIKGTIENSDARKRIFLHLLHFPLHVWFFFFSYNTSVTVTPAENHAMVEIHVRYEGRTRVFTRAVDSQMLLAAEHEGGTHASVTERYPSCVQSKTFVNDLGGLRPATSTWQTCLSHLL